MTWIVLVVFIAGAVLWAARAPASGAEIPDPKPDPKDLPSVVRDAIRREIVNGLGLPDSTLGILLAQSSLETGAWRAWYFSGPQKDGKPPTFNLFNRHAGTGRGEWTHETKYVSPGDADLRIYKDPYQSARDFVQLLHDPLYKWALIALKAGDGPGYFLALERAGFSATPGYAQAAQNRYDSMTGVA